MGGEDFDRRLIDYLADEFKKDQGMDLRGDPLAMQRLKEGAEKAKIELAAANKRVDEELGKSRNEAALRLADAERRGQALIEEAKTRASDEAAKIMANAQQEALGLVTSAREALREEVAKLAVQGAQKILRREVKAADHAAMLSDLKTQL